MRTAVPEKILKIIANIDTQGNASLTRLTVLKKWFGHPGRLAGQVGDAQRQPRPEADRLLHGLQDRLTQC